jgi:cellulose biosynthesis protein BcsQ
MKKLKRPGDIITFYSYKGGVGRSMALANVAVLLTKWNYKTLIIDWDLEAPGLEFFFKPFIEPEKVAEKTGVIDLLSSKIAAGFTPVSETTWRNYVTEINIDSHCPGLDLMSSGKKDADYISRVRAFSYDRFYEEHDGGQFLEDVRDFWKEQYDFVLIDSRTGLTDTSGICTIQIPDSLVLLFTATEHGFKGIINVAKSAMMEQSKVIYDRFKLNLLPIMARIDNSELTLTDDWIGRFASLLEKELLLNQGPFEDISLKYFLSKTGIPYLAFFSYGEKISVTSDIDKATNPRSLSHAYENLAAIIFHGFRKYEMLMDNRDGYVKIAKGEPEVYQQQTVEWKKSYPVATAHAPAETNISTVPGPAPAAKRRKYLTPIILAAVIIVGLITTLLTWKNNSAGTTVENPKAEEQAFLQFNTDYNSSNIYDPDVLTRFFKRFYQLTPGYRDSLKNTIQGNLELVATGIISDTMASFYDNLKKGALNTSIYFADTIHIAGLPAFTKSTIKTRFDSIYQTKKFNNIIIDSTVKLESDSTGFKVSYTETGSILPDRVDAYTNRTTQVTLHFNPDIKIDSINYQVLMKGKKETDNIFAIVETKTLWKIDLFSCSTAPGNRSVIQELKDRLEKTGRYTVTIRTLNVPSNKNSTYYITDNLLRFTADERKEADRIGTLVWEQTGIRLKTEIARTNTLNRLTIFMCSDISPMQQAYPASKGK